MNIKYNGKLYKCLYVTETLSSEVKYLVTFIYNDLSLVYALVERIKKAGEKIMRWIKLNNSESVRILEELRTYSENQLYFKIELVDGSIRIISKEEFGALKEIEHKTFSEEDKLSLFYSYFQGRPDVYATKYYNKKGRPGFSPHGNFQWEEVNNYSSNGPKWQKKMTSYFPYQLKTVKKHILGKEKDFQYGAGIYPMLADDTCYLLVMDFDDNHAEKEAGAVSHAASIYQIPHLIERSQSGTGIHIWFFFEKAIKAATARQMGTYLLSVAMAKSEYIQFSTFDRMIPMQDTLPNNSFGNLIALPLRWTKVKEGKTVFLNKKFNIVEDQWAHLAQIKKISTEELLKNISTLKNDVNYSSEQQSKVEMLTIRLAGEIMVDKSCISRNDFFKLTNLATFQNPDFIKKQKMRATTWNTPRYVSGASEDDRYLYLPRGMFNELDKLTDNMDVINELNDGTQIEVEFKGELKEDQRKAVDEMLAHSIGILSASTGFGKTVVAANIIAKRRVSCLIIVNSKVLAEQWKEQLNEFLEIYSEPIVEYTPKGRKKKKEKIGEIHSAKNKRSKIIDIALFQTLAKREDLKEFIKGYGMVIVDEAHHIAAQSFESVIKCVDSRYLYGLSATPERKDGYTPLIRMRLGSVIYEHQETQADTVLLPQYFYPRFTNYAEFAKENTYTVHIDSLLNNNERNVQILNDIIENLHLKRTCIVLTERIEHVRILKRLLKESGITQESVFVLTGQEERRSNKRNIEIMRKLEEPYVLIATGKYVGEGFDLPQLDTIFLTLPISWKGRLRQYLGRLQRNVGDKDELRVYDYVDLGISMFGNMYQKRLREYKKLGYNLAQDSKTKALEAGLYEANTYYKDLTKDLKQGTSIVIGVPLLSVGLIKIILEETSNDKKISVITKRSTAKNGKINMKQKSFIEELKKINIKISEVEVVSQSFIILDHEIAWYGNINFYGSVNHSATAIRLKNNKLAEQITAQYY